ncbi:uncharacterized protein LOC126374060 isoform X1 [Pectinophora gossypiella]|uniref:uncharacterized protein LOC126374060 isoform X1 n=1 Tax=Pectinophora gossypiella TaxID=13191 RepID=UPI00214EC9E0|nr:uncharacterized protein LOC126374060 isoform X1 [Pectinophora gossypiella]
MEREVMAGDTPLGLRQLMQTSYVEVRREFSCCDHHFTVAAPECGHFLVAKGLTTKHVRDTQDQVVMMFRNPQRFCELPSMEVYVGQSPALTIKYKGGFSRSLWIDDEYEQHVLKIKQPYSFFGTADYNVLGTNDAQVGVIKRDWTEYDVQFPKDLDVRYKGALIAACVFISIESQRRRH